MYDNNFNNEQHQGYYPNTVSQTYQQPPVQPQLQAQPRKKHSTMKVLALIMAVVVVGGGAGFGGSYVAAKLAGSSAVSSQDGGSNSSHGSSNDKESDAENNSGNVKPAPDVSNTNKPTLDEMQSGATVSHNISTETEFNSDGTFAYTRDLVSAVRDSIVYIEVYTKMYMNANEAYGAGSGIIISSDGYIITNAHVVDDMDKFVVHVTTTDPVEGTGVVDEYEATLVGSDTDTDLAVIKIEAEGLQSAVLGNSDELHLGDDVVVIGNPMGLETSVTKGIVSGLNRQLYSSERSLSSIQTDAAINSGNSGGALFNMYGEVVGVVNEKLISNYAENVGFAITINEAKYVIDDLISMGYVTGRPILGVTCLEVSEYVAAIQGMHPGLYITEINKDLAIADSELVVGDTIVAVEGQPVTNVSQVSEILRDMKPGDVVEVTVVRVDAIGRDKEITFDVELSEYSGS